MNINENKEIEAAAPSLEEWLRSGKDVFVPGIGDDYTLYLEDHPQAKTGALNYCISNVQHNYNLTYEVAMKVATYSLKKLEMI